MALAVVAGLAMSAATSQAQVMLNFSGGNIVFTPGGSFTFAGTGFTVTTATGTDVGGDIGLTGTISGNYTFGPVSGSNPYVAPVQGTGSLSLSGLTATVSFIEMSSFNQGTTINDQLQINLSNVSYSGGNPDLSALAASGIAVMDVVVPGYNVEQLYTNSVTDSYSGTITSAVPEPSTIVAGALMLLPLGIGTFRALRKERTA